MSGDWTPRERAAAKAMADMTNDIPIYALCAALIAAQILLGWALAG